MSRLFTNHNSKMLHQQKSLSFAQRCLCAMVRVETHHQSIVLLLALAIFLSTANADSRAPYTVDYFRGETNREQCLLRHGEYVDSVTVSPSWTAGPDAPYFQTVTVVKPGGTTETQDQRNDGRTKRQYYYSGGTYKGGICIYRDREGRISWNDGPSMKRKWVKAIQSALTVNDLLTLGIPKTLLGIKSVLGVAGDREWFWDAGRIHDNCYHHNPATSGQTKISCDDQFQHYAIIGCQKVRDWTLDVFINGTSDSDAWSEALAFDYDDCVTAANVWKYGLRNLYIVSDMARDAWNNAGTHVNWEGNDPSLSVVRENFLSSLPLDVADILERSSDQQNMAMSVMKAIVNYYADEASLCGNDTLCISAQYSRLYRNLFYYLDLVAGYTRYGSGGDGEWTFSESTRILNEEMVCNVDQYSAPEGHAKRYVIGHVQIHDPVPGFPDRVPLWGTGDARYELVNYDSRSVQQSILNLIGNLSLRTCSSQDGSRTILPNDGEFWLALYRNRLGQVKQMMGNLWPPSTYETELAAMVERQKWNSISTSEQRTCAVKANGRIGCWGQSDITGTSKRFRHVSTGTNAFCAIQDESFGNLLECYGIWPLHSAPESAADGVTVGQNHACLISVNQRGRVICWGADERNYGVLNAPAGSLFRQISAGFDTTCGVRYDGRLECWGRDYGEGSPDSIVIPNSGTFLNVSTGRTHACALRSDYTVVCWGKNTSGQSLAPAGTFTKISVGQDFSCGIRKDLNSTVNGTSSGGEVECWGANSYGQTNVPSGLFVDLASAPSGHHTCARSTQGTLVCWGDNSYGQAPGPLVLTAEGITERLTTPCTDADQPCVTTVLAGEPFEAMFDVQGGVPPYKWQGLESLPSGLYWKEEEDLLGGTPLAPGRFDFAVEVTDSLALPRYTKKFYSLIVSAREDGDLDGDGVPDAQDDCPLLGDPQQSDIDNDGKGDVCDEDIDGDGVNNVEDNCVAVANSDQSDADGNLQGDACAPPKPGDISNDGTIDKADYNLFRSALGKCEGALGYLDAADYDGDGCITNADYRTWYIYYKNQ